MNKETNLDIENNNSKPLLKKVKKKSFFGIVFDYARKHIFMSILIVVFTILSSVSTILSPKIIEYIMKNLLSKGSVNEIKPDLFGMELDWKGWVYVQLSLFGFAAIFTFISNYLAGIMGKNIEINLRNKTLEKLVKQDISYYSDKKIGEILTKIVSDTQIIGDQAQQVPVTLLQAIVTFFGSLIMMFTIENGLYLSITVVVTMAILLVIMFGSFGIFRKLMFTVRSSITNINGDVTDRISTIRLIKSSGTEEYETDRFKRIHVDYYKKSRKMINLQSTIITIMVAGISSIQMVIVIAAAIFFQDEPMKLAAILPSFISATGTMIGPIMQLARVTTGVAQASTSSVRVYEVLNSKSIMDPHYDGGIKIQKIEGNIIFKDVVFAYPEKPESIVLPKFNFTFEEGKSYAFVGETGVGKSTISKLLLRFYDPSEGKVIINGDVDLKDVNLSSYLEKVGYVEQEPQILFGNVLDNIRYGKFEATDEEVIEAAKKAELHELVETWPEKYETVLGERGFMLSGGQKQRLVIARMFLKNPQILILDEATSALDNIVEKEIQGNLEELMKGRTTVSIAHRLSTIKNADKIIVLAKNEGVSQIGTFNELKSVDGHFKDLYEAGLVD